MGKDFFFTHPDIGGKMAEKGRFPLMLLGPIVNAITVAIGAVAGTLFGSAISEKLSSAIIVAIGLMTMVLGVQFAIGTTDILILMISLVAGTILGVSLGLDSRMDRMGDTIKKKLSGTRFGKGKVVDAFVSTTILFCVGTMTVVGSIQSGLNGDHSILITKSIMDMISAVVFASALGGGVLLSAISVLVIEGSIALLAGLAAPVLTEAVVNEMSAVGGVIFIGLAINLTGISQKKIPIGDMLPAIFVPIVYLPLAEWIGGLFG